MKSAIDILENEYILTKNIFFNMRKYINIKYSHLSKIEIAKILSNTINKIFDEKLCGFLEKNKQEIKKYLIVNNIAQNRFDITANNILDYCIKIYEKDKAILFEFAKFTKNLSLLIPHRSIFEAFTYKTYLKVDKVENKIEYTIDKSKEFIVEDKKDTLVCEKLYTDGKYAQIEKIEYSQASKSDVIKIYSLINDEVLDNKMYAIENRRILQLGALCIAIFLLVILIMQKSIVLTVKSPNNNDNDLKLTQFKSNSELKESVENLIYKQIVEDRNKESK